tara:strand:- start:3277 stop:4263 length:987 start_codon:yes stop_codon:yes gene_type:complete
MISTKNFISQQNEIRSSWVFEYYLTLPEKLTGQDVQITSVFNASEKTPSMFVYLDPSSMEYKYKDFSTGKQGSKIDIVQELFSLSYSQALFRITEDYNAHVLAGNFLDDNTQEYKPVAKYKTDHVELKVGFTKQDQEYWLQYNIGSSLLKEYNVLPLEYYTMVKSTDEGVNKLVIENKMMYGFYNKTRTKCYKIYQPMQKKHKFIKIDSHLQGFDQLKYDKDYLVICSSLKDAMCLKSFDFGLEVIAPDSENTMIKPYIIQNLKSKYKKVLSLLDNDEAGHEAMGKYEKAYKITPIYLKSEKDLSDAVSKYGFNAVQSKLFNLIKEKI